jgi:hypothetical protein
MRTRDEINKTISATQNEIMKFFPGHYKLLALYAQLKAARVELKCHEQINGEARWSGVVPAGRACHGPK